MFESFSLMEKGQWLPGMGNLLGIMAVGGGVYLAKMAALQMEWMAQVMNAGGWEVMHSEEETALSSSERRTH